MEAEIAVNIKLSTETMESARQQAQIFNRTLSEQVNYWAHIGQRVQPVARAPNP